MNFAEVYFCDTGNGIGMRTSLYVSGCMMDVKSQPEKFCANTERKVYTFIVFQNRLIY